MDKREVGLVIGGIGAAALAILLLRKPVYGQVILQDLTINPTTVTPGQEVTISLTAINPTDETITVDITLGGDFMAQKTVTVNAGESVDVVFSVTPNTAKEYSVKINGLSGKFLCTEEPVADIRLSDLTINPSSCYVGDTVVITVTATNYGTIAGSKTISCTVT